MVCHCSRCRRAHGHVGAYTACARDHLVLVDDHGLSWYESDGRSRGFCSRCGSSLFWSVPERDTISIAAGTLDPPTGLRTSTHIYTADRGDYYELEADGAAHHDAEL